MHAAVKKFLDTWHDVHAVVWDGTHGGDLAITFIDRPEHEMVASEFLAWSPRRKALLELEIALDGEPTRTWTRDEER